MRTTGEKEYHVPEAQAAPLPEWETKGRLNRVLGSLWVTDHLVPTASILRTKTTLHPKCRVGLILAGNEKI